MIEESKDFLYYLNEKLRKAKETHRESIKGLARYQEAVYQAKAYCIRDAGAVKALEDEIERLCPGKEERIPLHAIDERLHALDVEAKELRDIRKKCEEMKGLRDDEGSATGG